MQNRRACCYCCWRFLLTFSYVYFSLSLCVSTFFLWTVLGYFNGVLPLAMQLNDCKVYFVMLIYIYIGGGWTLVVTISSKSNDHLQGTEVHCFQPTLCVPFVEENSDITARKLADKEIQEMMYFEGKAVSWIKGESFNK